MKIGILQADSVLDQFQPRHGNYPEMISSVLGQAAVAMDIETEFVTFDVQHGLYPPTLASCDGYVITGSRMSVYDDEPWIGALMDYVRALHQHRIKVVGLCFGHQLLAHALGGKTTAAEVGWGVGIHQSELVQPAWFMDQAPDSYNLIVSHKDQVTALPPGAELLAASEFCPHSMFCLGDHILAMQGHPEFDRDYSADLMNMRRETLGEETYQTGVASLEKVLMRDEVAGWIIRFLAGRQSIG